MAQHVMRSSAAYPKRREILFHLRKTGRLLGALFTDPRIPALRKILFIVVIVALLAILIFPDMAAELGLTFALPVVGTVLGVPIDAGFDWVTFSLLAVNLLHIFPAARVTEHYNNIFS